MNVYLPIVQGKPKPKPLTVMTYNIGDDANTNAMTPQHRADALAQLMKTHNIDVACLQEVIWKGDRAEIVALGAALKGWYAFDLQHNKQNHYCNMIISRHKIIMGSERTYTIKSSSGRADRVNLSVQIDTPQGIVRIFNIHTRFEEAGEGSRQSLEWIKELNDVPFIAAGDWNKTRGGLRDVINDVDIPLAMSQAGRIDHILVSGMTMLNTWLIPQVVPSSHYPIMATIERGTAAVPDFFPK